MKQKKHKEFLRMSQNKIKLNQNLVINKKLNHLKNMSNSMHKLFQIQQIPLIQTHNNRNHLIINNYSKMKKRKQSNKKNALKRNLAFRQKTQLILVKKSQLKMHTSKFPVNNQKKKKKKIKLLIIKLQKNKKLLIPILKSRKLFRKHIKVIRVTLSHSRNKRIQILMSKMILKAKTLLNKKW